MQHCKIAQTRSLMHFRNAFLCKRHNHGQQSASCGVDALAELYYHGVYPNDSQPRICGGNPLIQKLIHLCDLRDKHGPTCEVRNDVWNWLSNHISSYAPKGTSNAEILQAFESLSDSSNKFVATFNGQGICPDCQMKYSVHENLDPVQFYDNCISMKAKGNLELGIEVIFGNAIRSRVRRLSCNQCNVAINPDGNIPTTMPAFLIVSLPLDRSTKQVQQIAVKEKINVHGTSYTLVGAVQMRPGHFYCIVKRNGSFAVIDDLDQTVTLYPNFDAAVYKKIEARATSICTLSHIHDGVHLLLYSRRDQNRDIPIGAKVTEIYQANNPLRTKCGNNDSSLKVQSDRCSSEALNKEPSVRNIGVECTSVGEQMENSERIQGTETKARSTNREDGSIDESCSHTDLDNPTLNAFVGEQMENSESTIQGTETKARSTCTNREDGSIDESCSHTDLDNPTLNAFVGEQMENSESTIQGTETKARSTNREDGSIDESCSHTDLDNPTLNAFVGEQMENSESTIQGTETKARSTNREDGSIDESCSHSFQTNLDNPTSNAFGPKFTSTPKKKFSSNCKNKNVPKKKSKIYHSNRKEKNANKENLSQNVSDDRAHLSHQNGKQSRIPLSSVDMNTNSDNSGKSSASKLDERKKIKKVSLKTFLDESCEVRTAEVLGEKIPYIQVKSEVYISIEILPIIGIRKHEGYRRLDNIIMKVQEQSDPAAFLVGEKNARKWINRNALLNIIRQWRIKKDIDKEKLIETISCFTITCPHTGTSNPSTTIILCDIEVELQTQNDQIFIEFFKIAQLVGLNNHIKKRGWKYVDAVLAKEGIDVSLSFFGTQHVQTRSKRSFISLSAMKVLLTKFRSGDSNLKETVQQEILEKLEKLAASSFNQLSKKADTPGSRTCKSFEESNDSNNSEQQTTLNPEDLIYLTENFSGSKLRNELRKKIPGVFPSARKEGIAKKRYLANFHATLLPKRTDTGWYIDPNRLLDILVYRYPFLSSTLNVKLWGDGREIAGRHSTLMTMSLINHEMFLRNVSIHSPQHNYPFVIFYEGDTRDNLEINLVSNGINILENLVKSRKDDTFFITGDEMFLIKLLDGSNELSPMSETGWNFYHKCNKSDKSRVAVSGKRTELEILVDREHPESLVPSVPTKHFIFDILHGITRIVEKLLRLEIEKLLSHGNKNEQGHGMNSTQQLLANLVNNINKRGIRQGNFHVNFDKAGKLEPITLNKDHAVGIISPAPSGQKDDYPHVLSNVVSSSPMPESAQSAVKEYFVKQPISEFNVVNKIWDCIFEMYTILRTEPDPVLKEGKPKGSLRPTDYEWGCTPQRKEQYKKHAECFYQLMCFRYTWNNITPYMIKFIDYARYFLDYLDLPLCRFNSEGGEHLNYCHSSYFFKHTTRHGGKLKIDPQFSYLLAMYRNLSYEIASLESAEEFNNYVDRHVAACKIQAAYRGYHTRRIVREEGSPSNVLGSMPSSRQKCEDTSCTQGIFQGKSFVFVGMVPNYKKKKYTQQILETEVKKVGGRVKKALPGNVKGRSSKMYNVLVNKHKINKDSKLPETVTEAYRRHYNILDYDFVFKSMEDSKLQSMTNFVVPMGLIVPNITKEQTLHAKHFQKVPRMISLLKKEQKKRKPCQKQMKLAANPVLFYANIKRKEAAKGQMSFHEQSRRFGKFCKEFKDLPPEEKKTYEDQWNEMKTEYDEFKHSKVELKTYNSVCNPLFKKQSNLNLNI